MGDVDGVGSAQCNRGAYLIAAPAEISRPLQRARSVQLGAWCCRRKIGQLYVPGAEIISGMSACGQRSSPVRHFAWRRDIRHDARIRVFDRLFPLHLRCRVYVACELQATHRSEAVAQSVKKFCQRQILCLNHYDAALLIGLHRFRGRLPVHDISVGDKGPTQELAVHFRYRELPWIDRKLSSRRQLTPGKCVVLPCHGMDIKVSGRGKILRRPRTSPG